ncbi:MAG: photosystem II stability/assembly factor-like uncharacterized protein [Rhodothermales bacterium]|jgi:photosystem II stability/assembly factor-like uncharacterized protein
MRSDAFLRRVLTGTLCTLVAVLTAFPLALPANAQKLDLEKLKPMAARAIGPAGMSGRVTAIDVVLRTPEVIYAGTASGGLWRSRNAGISWEPIFDDQPTHSIGAVAINQGNPDVIWVGTGEGNPRNSSNTGNGIYKSIDGGHSWTHLGLEESRSIHRILLHPNDPNTAYVGAQGPAWGESEQRGVFKTTDGGATWERVLFTNVRTGIADMVMDPVNPDKIIAAMWEFRRWPYFLKSGGEGSGIHVTFDGGKTWTKRSSKDGLPEGELGRIGLAIAPSDPSVVYAIVEAKENAWMRSNDGGFTFSEVNAGNAVTNRPFYYNDIFVDPLNEHRVYWVASNVQVTNNGGGDFEPVPPRGTPGGGIHPDHHAFWINPDDPTHIIEGNDGGLNISHDHGKTWRFAENIPVAQFYHINVDMEIPYNVMGGLQDNGSWIGPSEAWRAGGIRNSYWREVGFGDGFDVVSLPDDSRYVYSMSQGGNVRRFDTQTGQSVSIKPLHPDGPVLRFNWNAAIAQDPHDASTVYYGSQFLHKSTDRGNNWSVISPDLTTNDPSKQDQINSGGLNYDVTGAENFTTIVSIAPSPKDPKEVWVGTDDGNVQVTRDGGTTWTNTVLAMKGLDQGGWVTQIKASEYNAGEAFVVIDDHRRNSMEPYLYHTNDYGNSWTRLAPDVSGYALSFVQDPIEPRLMFLGTDTGVHVSVDAGATWTHWTNGMPTMSAMDMVIHPRDHDLVVGTFGRSVYILDDIRPLRAIASEGADILDAQVKAFPAPDGYMASWGQADGTRFSASGMFEGENVSRGAAISYVVNLPERPEGADEAGARGGRGAGGRAGGGRGAGGGGRAAGAGGGGGFGGGGAAGNRATIEIVNSDGEVIRTVTGPAEPGLNRYNWQMRSKGFQQAGGGFGRGGGGGGFGGGGGGANAEPAGPDVLPGTYKVRITAGRGRRAATDSTTITIHPDPRSPYNRAGAQARIALYWQLEPMTVAARAALDQLTDAQSTLDWINTKLSADSSNRDLTQEHRAVTDSLTAVREVVFGQQGAQGIRRDPNTLTGRMRVAQQYISRSTDMPGATEQMAIEQSRAAVEELVELVNGFMGGRWAEFVKAVEDADLPWFKPVEPIRIGN